MHARNFVVLLQKKKKFVPTFLSLRILSSGENNDESQVICMASERNKTLLYSLRNITSVADRTRRKEGGEISRAEKRSFRDASENFLMRK